MMCAFSYHNIEAKRQTGGILSSKVSVTSAYPKYWANQTPALTRAREVVENALNGPIAAIDTRDDLLEAIRDTRLSDPDSWRAVIQNAPLTERKYLQQVYDLLAEFASESHGDSADYPGNAFIYNFRTGSCLYYDLGSANER
jgi:translation initiation factor 2-alpha kinase 4